MISKVIKSLELQNTQLVKYSWLSDINFERENESSFFTVEFVLRTTSPTKNVLKLICYGANEISFKPIGNVSFCLSIKDISARQLQDYIYEMNEIENEQLSFVVRDFELSESESLKS